MVTPTPSSFPLCCMYVRRAGQLRGADGASYSSSTCSSFWSVIVCARHVAPAWLLPYDVQTWLLQLPQLLQTWLLQLLQLLQLQCLTLPCYTCVCCRLLPYGVLAGGLLSSKYLGAPASRYGSKAVRSSGPSPVIACIHPFLRAAAAQLLLR